MLFAKFELFSEDPNSVPLFERCKFDAEELEFLRTHHPVWSAMPALQTEGFKTLVAEMKLLWAKRDAMWGEMIAERERCTIGNVHSCVLAAKVAELKRTVAGQGEKMAVDHASQTAQIADVVLTLSDIHERRPCPTRSPPDPSCRWRQFCAAAAASGSPGGAGARGAAQGAITMMDHAELMFAPTKRYA